MRRTLYLWWCGGCKTQNAATHTHCIRCGTSRKEKHAQVHTSERAVVYYNPATGERRTPPRADQPMPEVYARQGYERREILNMTQYERDTGLVHEATSFHPGNEPSPSMDPPHPKMPREARERLIDDVRAAIASGPFTDESPDGQVFTAVAPV